MAQALKDSFRANFSGVVTKNKRALCAIDCCSPSTVARQSLKNSSLPSLACPPKCCARTRSRLIAKLRKSRKCKKCSGNPNSRSVCPNGAVSTTMRSYFPESIALCKASNAEISAMPGKDLSINGSMSCREKSEPRSMISRILCLCSSRNSWNCFPAFTCHA